MKKFRKLIPALAMLLVSAVLMSTASYAWFSMNTQVTATGMMVKAQAESGLLISEVKETTGTWDNSATGGSASSYALIPMSTANGTDWFHANSKVTSDAAANTSSTSSANLVNGYETPSLLSNSKTAADTVNCAVDFRYKEVDGTSGYNDKVDQGAYVKYTFYIKSSAGEITCKNAAVGDQYVELTNIQISGLNASKTLDAALRIGVKLGSTFYIYAPISDSTNTYYVGTSRTQVNTQPIYSAGSELTADGTVVYKTVTDLATLPAFTAQGAAVEIYLWIEGEDANCISNNIKATLDDLSISVNFSLVTKTA